MCIALLYLQYKASYLGFAGLLLEMKQPAEALSEFELTLMKEPNRFWSLYGAAEASKEIDDRDGSRKYFQKLLKIAERSDQPGRREMVEARSEIGPDASLYGHIQ